MVDVVSAVVVIVAVDIIHQLFSSPKCNLENGSNQIYTGTFDTTDTDLLHESVELFDLEYSLSVESDAKSGKVQNIRDDVGRDHVTACPDRRSQWPHVKRRKRMLKECFGNFFLSNLNMQVKGVFARPHMNR